MVLTVLAIAAQFLRVILDGGDVGESILAILEWTNAILLVTFINVDVYSRM
jgi:hypothetical protein